MQKQNHGFHHLHLRKRVHQKLEKYPHPHKYKRIMDELVYVMGIFGPVMSLPQVIKIWSEQDASSISLLTWVAYLFGSICWLIYGIMHQEKPIIISNFLYVFVNVAIIIGVIIY